MKKLTRIFMASLTVAVSLTASAWEATSMKLSTARMPEQDLLQVEKFSADATTPKPQKQSRAYAPVTNPPGTKKNLAFTGIGVSERGQELIDGYAVDMYVDGTDVYIRNLVYYGNDNSYCKGTLEGDLQSGMITFENGVEYAAGKYAYIGGMDPTGQWLVADKEAETFTYAITNGLIRLEVPGTTGAHAYLLGLDEYDALQGYTIDNTYVKMSPLTNTVIPQDCTLNFYQGNSAEYDNVPGFEFSCKIGISGSDVYITNLSSAAPEIVLHGTLSGDNKIVIETGWIGIYRNTYIQLIGCKVTYDENNKPVMRPSAIEQLTFDYDPEDKSITAKSVEDSFAIIAGAQTVLSYYLEPSLYYIWDEVTTLPEDAVGKPYVVKKDAISYNGSSTFEMSFQTVYADSNDNYYFSGSYSGDTNIVFKATQDRSDRMAIQLPQLIGENNEGKPLYLYEATLEVNDMVFPPVAYFAKKNSSGTIYVNMDRATGVYTFDGTVCACTIDASTANFKNGYSNSVWTPNDNYVENTLPEGIEMTPWYLTSTSNYSHVRMHNIEAIKVLVGNVGDDWYIKGIDTDDSGQGILKGTMVDNKLVISVPQFFTEKNSLTMAYAGDFQSVDEYDVLDTDQFVFTFDSETNTLSSDGMLILRNLLNQDMYWFYEPVIKKHIENENAVPKNPMPVSGEEYDDGPWESMGRVYTAWEIFPESTEGIQLDIDNIFYSVFVDGEMITFTPRDFKELCEYCGGATTEVPLSFIGKRIDAYRNERRIHLFVMPKQTIGVQTFFRNGDNETHSEIVTYNIQTGEITIGQQGGIEGINSDKTITSEQLYDLTGRPVSESSKGIFIKVTKYADGTANAQKVIL